MKAVFASDPAPRSASVTVAAVAAVVVAVVVVVVNNAVVRCS
jgi:hypothetical protein